MPAFAVYRLPYGKFATKVQQTDGEPLELSSCAELNGKRGFVMAPFETTANHPILLIRPDLVERIDMWKVECGMWKENSLSTETVAESNLIPLSTFHIPQEYSIDFANFHSQLELGTFRKIVLARCPMPLPS